MFALTYLITSLEDANITTIVTYRLNLKECRLKKDMVFTGKDKLEILEKIKNRAHDIGLPFCPLQKVVVRGGGHG